MRSSTYIDYLNSLNAQWGKLNQRDTITSFGDAASEARHIRNGHSAIADRSERDLLVIDGDDAAQWLQGMVTNHVYQLAEEGSGHLTTVVNVHGRIVAEMRLCHVQDLLIADLEPGVLDGPLIPHFRRHIIMEKVQFLDRRDYVSRIGLYGENIAEQLQNCAKLSHDLQKMPYYHATVGLIAENDIVVQKIPLVGVDGFEISCNANAIHKLWPHLIDCIENIKPIGFDALEILRIEAGIPRFGADMDEKSIPLEVGLDNAINFEKGCYLGQEIIARLDSRGEPARLLRTLLLPKDSPIPQPEQPINDAQNKSIGIITSACYSPILERPIALASIKRKHNDIGNSVRLNFDDTAVSAEIVANGYAFDH